jgi:hypothetical protein
MFIGKRYQQNKPQSVVRCTTAARPNLGIGPRNRPEIGGSVVMWTQWRGIDLILFGVAILSSVKAC